MCRSHRSLVALVAFALAPACSDDSSGTVIVSGDPVDDTVADGQAQGDALANQTADELFGVDFLTQISIAGTILASLNDAEINVSDFAAQIVVDADIADYASELIIDHDDANAELDSVMRFYGVGFTPSPTADALASQASADIGTLRASADPDFDFVDIQVFNHAAAQVLLDELLVTVGPGEMGDYIQGTMDMIDTHLAEGEDLLSTFF